MPAVGRMSATWRNSFTMTEELHIKPISVSECVELVRTTLQSVVGELTVYGEVSELQRRSGESLLFFSLKDATSYLRCFMLEHELKTEISDGMEIRVTGYPSLFKKNSGFHLRVKRIELIGEGALQKQLELTKKKLEKEGVFAQQRKRALPRFPEHIGIITSEDAAAFTDVRRVLSNRWPYAVVTLVPSQVQGAPAIKQLIQAFDRMENDVQPDIIILTRGGGSLEDLQSFNSEELARRIFSTKIPVVVGVGHERDWTIADLVADIRAATPSNAAELSTPVRDDIFLQIEALVETNTHVLRKSIDAHAHELYRSITTLSASMKSTLRRVEQSIARAEIYGSHLLDRLRAVDEKISHSAHLLTNALSSHITTIHERYKSLRKLLMSVSPQAVLRRGYSITRRNGKIIRSSKSVREHDILKTTLSDGEIESEVT